MNILEETQKSATTRTATPIFGNTPSFSNNSNYGQGNTRALSDSLIAFDLKTLVIISLLIIMVLAYIKINVITIFGETVQTGVDFFTPVFAYLLDFMGDSSGKAINKAAEVTADVSKGGIDLAEGAVQEVGNLLIGQSDVGSKKKVTLYMNPSQIHPKIISKNQGPL